MRSSLSRLAIALLALALAGCSIFQKDPTPEEARVQRLIVPPDLVLEEDEAAFAIPDEPGTATASSLAGGTDRPVLAGAAGVRVRRAGGERWLEVDAVAGRVYDWVERFLTQSGAGISRRVPELGILQSVWLMNAQPLSGGVFSPVVERPEDAEVADQYLIRLEEGDAPGTTAVYVSHRRAVREAGGWELEGSDPFLTAEFQRALMLHLGVDRRRAQREIAEGASAAVSSQVERAADGEPVLRLEESFLPAWQRVGVALDRAGFTVVDRNRSARRYFVRYDRRADEAPDEGGALSALAFWRSDEEDSVVRYRIDLDESEGVTWVQVRTEDGEPAEEEVAERLLGLVQQQLR